MQLKPAIKSLLVLALLLSPGGTAKAAPQAEQAPLPELSAFVANVRARLRSDRALQAQYTFLERREEINVSKLGKVKDGPVKVYEVYPSLERGNTYKRLISVDGKPLSAAELEKNDKIHQQHIQFSPIHRM